MKPTALLGCCLLIACGGGDLSSGGGIDLGIDFEREPPNIDITGTWKGQASCSLTDSGRRFEYAITINFQQDRIGGLTGSVEMPPCLQLMPIIAGDIFLGGICSGPENVIDFRAEGLGRSLETTGFCQGLVPQQTSGPLNLPFSMVTDVSGCPGGSGFLDFDATSFCSFSVSR